MSSDLIELVHDEQLDTSEVLRFQIPATSPKAYLLQPDHEIAWRDRRFTISEIEDNRDGSATTITVEAEATWYELGRDAYVGSLVLTEQTVADGLAAILENTGWDVGLETSSSADVFSLEAQDKTYLELVRLWAKVTGRFVVFDAAGRTVSLVDQRGADLGLGFRYRRNVRRIRKRTRPPTVTRLYPFGADGLTIAGVNGGVPYVEDLSYYTDQGVDLDAIGPDGRTNRERLTRAIPWSDTSFTRDTDLLAAAQAKLERLAQPIVSYELDVVDLTELTAVVEQVRVGDTVRVADPAFTTDVRTTVVRLERHPNDPKRNRVELAYLPPLIEDTTASVGRASSSQEWLQFLAPVSADFRIRNDGTYTVARIPLRFREGGRANYHLELYATGVGVGIMHVEIYDAVNDEVVWRQQDVAYTDDEQVRVTMSWAADALTGAKDYRVRVTTTADGGPDPANGVDLTIEPDDGPASFWILAQGAVQETPTAENSQTFNYTGSVQTFMVPDNVTEVTITARGAQGGGAQGGNGGEVTATLPVTPGAVLDVYVGGQGTYSTASGIGWPNGGATPETADGEVAGGSGGGSSHVIPTGQPFADALIVAPGGGGSNRLGASRNSPDAQGGAGGFFAGRAGWGLTPTQTEGVERSGGGATQFTGGTGGPGGGTAGTLGQGGASATTNNAFSFAGGGGGGGWYGGGGAGSPILFGGGSYAGDGGGGSGYVHPDGYDIAANDGSRTGNGQVVISWETPA